MDALPVQTRINDIRETMSRVSPFSHTRLLVHLMPLIDEIERLRAVIDEYENDSHLDLWGLNKDERTEF